MKKWMTGCLIVVLAGLSGQALAQRPGRGPAGREPAGRGPDRVAMMKEAGLSDEQIAALRDVRDGVRREVIELRSEMQVARLDFRKEMEADTPGEAAVMAALERVHAAQLQVRKAQVRGLLKAREIAGPEAWASIREQTGDWFEERMEQNRDGRGPRPRQGFRGDDDRGPPEGRPRGPRGDDDARGPPPWAGR